MTGPSLKRRQHYSKSLDTKDFCSVLYNSPLLCSPVREGDQTMDHFHAMWESLLFQWLPGKQPLPSSFEAFGFITTGAHLMWSPHLTSSSLFPSPRRLEGQSRRTGPQIVVDHLHVNTETRPGSGFNIEGVRCTEVPLCVHI